VTTVSLQLQGTRRQALRQSPWMHSTESET